MNAPNPVLSVRDLRIDYALQGRSVEAVRGVDLDLLRSRTLALVGESGSGKTTIGRALLGLLPRNASITEGTIDLGGADLRRADARTWRTVRGTRVALIPQDPTVSLSPLVPIGRQIVEALALHGDRADAAGWAERAVEILDIVGIPDARRRAGAYPHELSGGQQQRVLIGIAIANEPEVLIADEPTSGLDVTVQRRILDLLDEIQRERGTAILHITHDLAVAADRADDVVVLQSGRVVEHDRSSVVLAAPRSAYAAQLVANARSTAVRERTAPLDRGSAVLRAEGLGKRYGGRRGHDGVVAVDDLSFTIHRQHTLALVGESGSGKSTTGRLVAKLLQADSGRLELEGVDVTALPERRFRPLRAGVQIVYQNPYASLDPTSSVGRSIEAPLIGLRDRSTNRAARRGAVLEALDAVELPRDFAERRPHELSGGQKQRVAIARAIVARPGLIVLDEPVSALDVTVQEQILELLVGLQGELGLSYLFITHDLGVVRRIADDAIVLAGGRAVESGPVERLFSSPSSPITQALLDAVPGGRPRRADPVERELVAAGGVR